MLIFLAVASVSLIVMVVSADKFIDGTAALALNLKVSPLIVGLLILGFGTSAPEIMVSVFAALDDKPELALGNALGSNIANIALVLGATSLIYPIVIKSATIRREFWLFIASVIATLILLLDFELSRSNGIILLSLLVMVLGWMIIAGKKADYDTLEEEIAHDKHIPAYNRLDAAIVATILGLLFLLFSSKALVWAATNIASLLGLSELIIGLTIVAIGTSLPELAASIVAARREEPDLVVGNIIGSNIFNLLAVIGVSALIKPFTISTMALSRDFVLMAGLSVLLFALIFIKGKETAVLTRTNGTVFSLIYLAYLGLLIYQNI